MQQKLTIILDTIPKLRQQRAEVDATLERLTPCMPESCKDTVGCLVLQQKAVAELINMMEYKIRYMIALEAAGINPDHVMTLLGKNNSKGLFCITAVQLKDESRRVVPPIEIPEYARHCWKMPA